MPVSHTLLAAGDRGIAVQVGLFLAGLSGEEQTAAGLGIGGGEFRRLLREMGLADLRMTPVAVGPDLETTFLDMRGQPFDAPAFDMSVDQARAGGRRPAMFSLPGRAIVDAPVHRTGSGPPAIILHVGRCGSTLLCNLLANSGGWTAIREPELLNSLFLSRAAARNTGAGEQIDALAERIIDIFTGGTSPNRCVIKLSSWTAALVADMLGRRCDMRVVVVVRDPWATVASLLAEPPHWYGACAGVARSDRPGAARFFAGAWRNIIRTARQLPDERTLFVRYEDIVGDPAAMLRRVRRHLGDPGAMGGPAELAQSIAHYSKGQPGEVFDPAGRHRREALAREVSDEVSDIAARDWDMLCEAMRE